MDMTHANTVLLAHESGELLSSDPNAEHTYLQHQIISTHSYILLEYLVAQVQAILQPDTNLPCSSLLYVDFFNFLNQHYVVVDSIHVPAPTPDLEMFIMHGQRRSDGQYLGNIVLLDNVCQVVQLIPKFGARALLNMTCNNSLEIVKEFYVNSFADKEMFHAILSYQ